MPRLLVVVAHPDDETFGTGSVIANAAAEGHEVIVCCATRGEAGHDTSGTTTSSEELARARESELREAAALLGAGEVVLLDGFADSGFDGEMPADGLAAVPIARVIEPIVELLARTRPDVVVTFDPDSISDHRDHTRIGTATTAAFAAVASDRARLYHWTLARSVMQAWQEDARRRGVLEDYVELELGRPDHEITTIVDVAHVLETRRAAIATHRTQTSPFEGTSEELLPALLTRDHFVRVVPPWSGGPIETTLFG
jgi:LmbE family N-acetylglucosaminyl deacetylase